MRAPCSRGPSIVQSDNRHALWLSVLDAYARGDTDSAIVSWEWALSGAPPEREEVRRLEQALDVAGADIVK